MRQIEVEQRKIVGRQIQCLEVHQPVELVKEVMTNVQRKTKEINNPDNNLMSAISFDFEI